MIKVDMFIREKGVLPNSNRFFHTPSKIALSTFFYMICTGEFICDGTYKVERDNFNSFLIMYVKEGNGVALDKNKSFTAKENDVGSFSNDIMMPLLLKLERFLMLSIMILKPRLLVSMV